MNDRPRRFYIRYSALWWSDTRWFYGIFLLVVLGIIGYNVSRRMSVVPLMPVVVLDVVILVSFYVLYRLSYLEIAATGLRIRYGFRSALVPYEVVGRVRKQPLEVAFQAAERRRYVNRFVRRLGKQPAVYIRTDRRNPSVIADLQRRLGPRLVYGTDLVLPITDTEVFLTDIKSHLRKSALR